MHFFTVMRKNTVALNQAITYNDTQSKFIGRLRNWIDVLSEILDIKGYLKLFVLECQQFLSVCFYRVTQNMPFRTAGFQCRLQIPFHSKILKEKLSPFAIA